MFQQSDKRWVTLMFRLQGLIIIIIAMHELLASRLFNQLQQDQADAV